MTCKTKSWTRESLNLEFIPKTSGRVSFVQRMDLWDSLTTKDKLFLGFTCGLKLAILAKKENFVPNVSFGNFSEG